MIWYALPSHAQTSMCLECTAWVVGGGGGGGGTPGGRGGGGVGGGGGGGGGGERERLPVEETGTVVEKYCLKNEQQCVIRFLNLTILYCEVFERL